MTILILSVFPRTKLKRKHNYFVLVMHDTKTYSDSTNMLAKSDIIKILEIWIDSMFAMFDGRALQQ